MDSGEVTRDDITSNTNQMKKSTKYSYESLPHQPTKYIARITDGQEASETMIATATTKYQQGPPSSYHYNKSSTLPRSPKIKLKLETREDNEVSCF